MNEFVDMHVHSKFSIDGMSTMEDYCLIAGKTGTRVICFTEHVDFNSAEKNLSIVKDNRKQNFVVDDYFREINRLRKKYGSLTLLSGIEFSEPSLFPEEFALYSSYPFDCITAGIHHCYNSVFPGAGNLSVSKAIYEYYQIMQKTVELGGFQVLAHLDFPKLFFDKWVIDDDVLDMILSTMIDKNILLEVNTSSLNDSCDEPMPSSIEVNPVGVHGTCNIDNSREPVEINISNYSTAPGFLSGALVGGATKTAIIMSLSNLIEAEHIFRGYSNLQEHLLEMGVSIIC